MMGGTSLKKNIRITLKKWQGFKFCEILYNKLGVAMTRGQGFTKFKEAKLLQGFDGSKFSGKTCLCKFIYRVL